MQQATTPQTNHRWLCCAKCAGCRVAAKLPRHADRWSLLIGRQERMRFGAGVLTCMACVWHGIVRRPLPASAALWGAQHSRRGALCRRQQAPTAVHTPLSCSLWLTCCTEHFTYRHHHHHHAASVWTSPARTAAGAGLACHAVASLSAATAPDSMPRAAAAASAARCPERSARHAAPTQYGPHARTDPAIACPRPAPRPPSPVPCSEGEPRASSGRARRASSAAGGI